MTSPSDNAYLANQIRTATPQRLRLMLLDGALRFGRRSAELWEAGQPAEAEQSLIRCQDVVCELLSSLRPEVAPELTAQVANLQAFILRTLIAAQIGASPQKLAEALHLLEIERETWQRLCEQMTCAGEAPAPHVRTESLLRHA